TNRRFRDLHRARPKELRSGTGRKLAGMICCRSPGGRTMARGQKGAGSVFQRTYRDARGRKKRTNNWYVEYVVGGRTIREATEYTKRSDAIEFLKERVSDGLSGK